MVHPSANDAPLRHAYDLNGVTLAVAAADEGAATFLERLLSPLSMAVDGLQQWTVTLTPADAAAIGRPDGLPVLFDENLPEGLPALLVEAPGGRRFIMPGHLDMAFDRANRHVAIRYVCGEERHLSGTSCYWMLAMVLAASGRQLLHGASLVEPRSGQAIALFAPSGTGKSTTTLALARAGFAVAGDDAMVLDAGGPRPLLWSIPRAFKVHRRTAAMLPWLQPVLRDAWKEDEQAIPYRLVRTLVPVAPPLARPVGLVIVLLPPNGEGHRLRRMARPEALAAIASDNIRVAPGGVDADNAEALAAVARLVAATPVASLSVGPDPASLSPEFFANL